MNKDFVTDWETNEKLSLGQREKYRHIEDAYLRERFPKKEKTVNYTMHLDKAQYIMIDETLYKVVKEKEDCYVCTRGSSVISVAKESVIQEEGKSVWKHSC